MKVGTALAILLCLSAPIVGCRGGSAAPATTATTGGPPAAEAFSGHFAAGCAGFDTPCFELWLEQDGKKLRGWHAAATRGANKIEGGEYYDQGKNAPPSVHGEVHGDTATVTFMSAHTGQPVTGTLTLAPQRLTWKTTAKDLPAVPSEADLQRK